MTSKQFNIVHAFEDSEKRPDLGEGCRVKK